jgi:hypothetical protein
LPTGQQKSQRLGLNGAAMVEKTTTNKNPESEITPEMLEAGVLALEEGLLEDGVLQADWFRRDLVKSIFCQMGAARLPKAQRD